MQSANYSIIIICSKRHRSVLSSRILFTSVCKFLFILLLTSTVAFSRNSIFFCHFYIIFKSAILQDRKNGVDIFLTGRTKYSIPLSQYYISKQFWNYLVNLALQILLSTTKIPPKCIENVLHGSPQHANSIYQF